jgi:hypothetical protein
MSNICENDDCIRTPAVYMKYEGPSWWHQAGENRIWGKTTNFYMLYGKPQFTVLTFHLCKVCADGFLASNRYRLINKEEHDVIKVMNS